MCISNLQVVSSCRCLLFIYESTLSASTVRECARVSESTFVNSQKSSQNKTNSPFSCDNSINFLSSIFWYYSHRIKSTRTGKDFFFQKSSSSLRMRSARNRSLSSGIIEVTPYILFFLSLMRKCATHINHFCETWFYPLFVFFRTQGQMRRWRRNSGRITCDVISPSSLIYFR